MAFVVTPVRPDISCRIAEDRGVRAISQQAGIEMDVVATGVTKAGDALARPLLRKLVNELVGTPFERQLSEACRRAVTAAVQAHVAETEPPEVVSHKVDLLRQLIDRTTNDPVELILMTNGLAGWENAAEDLGLDLATLADDPGSLLTMICRQIPLEIARSAGDRDSALFAPFIVQSLLLLTRQLDGPPSSLLQERSWRINKDLHQAIDSVAVAGSPDQRLDTPSLLLALLRCRTGVTADLLDRASAGVQQELMERLEAFRSVRAFTQTRKIPFRLRSEYVHAQRVAVEMSTDSLDEAILLSAFLRTPSNTRHQLARKLGESYLRFELLVHAKLMNLHGDRRTPESLFG